MKKFLLFLPKVAKIAFTIKRRDNGSSFLKFVSFFI